MNLRCKTGLAVTAAFAYCGVAHAQVASAPPQTSAAPTASADDMPVPDDLGAPLAGAATAAPAPGAATRALSVDSPIEQIAANPQGKAALEHVLPGLCERPEYPMFKTMSLKALAGMSSGRITAEKLGIVQADLTRIGPVDTASLPAHGALYPLTHTAAYSIHYGGKQIGSFSRAIYHRVVLVIASM